MMRVYMLAFFSFTISGCATSYIEPSGDNVSRMRILAPQTETFASMRIMTYPSGECRSPQSVGMIGGKARFSKDNKLGIPTSTSLDDKQYIERIILSGEKFMFSVRGFFSNATCTVTVDFLPEHKKDYEVEYIWDRQKCYLSINQVMYRNGVVELAPADSVAQKVPSCGKGFT